MADPVSHYTFLPWYRTGLASVVDRIEGDRGALDISVHTKIGGAAEDFKRPVHLIGPGDIVGIDARAVVRVEPRPFSNDFEPNYLAAIEFFDEDYAWRYSPRAPEAVGKGRLVPWIALIVLEEGTFGISAQGQGLPSRLSIRDTSVLPPPDQLWAWAHAHLNAVAVDPKNPKAAADQIAANPAASCCRVVAAQHLQVEKAYRAFLVPTFDSGRRAGLLDGGAAGGPFAWTPGTPATLPVYYEWSFRTGQGDFKELVLRLRTRAADPTVGRRPMDVSQPLANASFPLIRNQATPPRPVLDLEGALQVPGAQPSAWEPQSKLAFQEALAHFINLGEAWVIKNDASIDGEPPLPNGIKLPVVLPPASGRFHANVDTLDYTKSGARWLEQLNLDPRNRVAAAFGTLVVQKNQEDFMARAWKQYGELFQANRLRFRAQLFREVLTAMVDKHLTPLPEERALTVTSLVHARVLMPGDARTTVFGQIGASALPTAAVLPPMRRVLRDHGPVAKRFGSATPHLQNIVRDVAAIRVSVSPKWAQPQERLSLASTPPGLSTAGTGVAWFGSEWDTLRPAIITVLELCIRLAPRLPQLTATISFLQEVLKQGDLQSTLSAANLTPEAVADVRTAARWVPPSFDPASLRPEEIAPAEENRNFSFVAWNFRQAALDAMTLVTFEIRQPKARPALDVAATAGTLKTSLSPYATVRERMDKIAKLPPVIRMPDYDPLEKILAYPRFDDATYEYLKKISQDYLVPNLQQIGPNTITLLEVNWGFTESFLVGLNHEMGRELLWRRYYTDQRGSYFRLFWDVRSLPGALDKNGKVLETKLDIHPIHGWRLGGALTPLGGNRPKGRPDVRNLVLVIRGDLLRRYPNTQVYAARAVPNPTRAEFKEMNRRPEDDLEVDVQHPVLFAKFDPDIYCYGFNLERDEALGRPMPQSPLGWYFVLAERFGEPRFGLDAGGTRGQTVSDANELKWGNVLDEGAVGAVNLTTHVPVKKTLTTGPGTAIWASDAADMAAILLREPFRMYYHASDMLAPKP